MKDILTLLKTERSKTVLFLKEGKEDELSYLQQLDKAIGWLTMINEQNLDSIKKYEIHNLPDQNYGYSFYHLMIDCESSDPKNWIEYKPNEKDLELSSGDVVLQRKPQ